MQKLFIHIGTHKTGTTAFQQVIFKEKFKLAKREKLYVINLHSFLYMKELMAAEIYSSMLIEKLSEFLKDKIKNTQGSFLISHEGLSGNPDQFYKNNEVVAQILYEATRQYETILIVVLRRQDEFVQSMYTQKIHEGNAFGADEFLADKKLDCLDWNNFLHPFVNCFGQQNVHVYPYDRSVLQKKSIVDLINMTLHSKVLAEVNHVQRKNIGYSRNALEIAGQLNERLTSAQRKLFRSVLQEISNKGECVEYNIFPPEQKRQIVAHFEESNKILSRLYFKDTFGMTNYSDPVFENEERRENTEDVYRILVVQLLSAIERKDNELIKCNSTFFSRYSSKAYLFFSRIFKRILFNLD